MTYLPFQTQPHLKKHQRTLLKTLSQEKSKIFLKNSYLLLTWFAYFATITKRRKYPVFAFLPKKNFFLTHTKAPIAHKNWSKEQFSHKYFTYVLTFKGSCSALLSPKADVNSLLYAILTTRFSMFTFETNTLLLKNYRIFYNFLEPKFFNFNLFLK